MPAFLALRAGAAYFALVFGAGFLLGPIRVLWLALRGLSLADYLAQRDPVAAAVYYAMLAVFALMPLVLARR